MTSDQAEFLLQFCTGAAKREWAITERLLRAVPESGLDYRPDTKSKSALELAWHIVSSRIWFLEGINRGEFARGSHEVPAEVRSIADILGWVKERDSGLMSQLLGHPDGFSHSLIDFFGMFKATPGELLHMLVTHEVHHRGQLSTYVRAMGGKVPSIYGDSADSK